MPSGGMHRQLLILSLFAQVSWGLDRVAGCTLTLSRPAASMRKGLQTLRAHLAASIPMCIFGPRSPPSVWTHGSAVVYSRSHSREPLRTDWVRPYPSSVARTLALHMRASRLLANSPRLRSRLYLSRSASLQTRSPADASGVAPCTSILYFSSPLR